MAVSLINGGVVCCAQNNHGGSLVVAVPEIKRVGDDDVQFNITLTNKGGKAVFIPDIPLPDGSHIFALQVLHLHPQLGWVTLGPFRDVPTTHVAVLSPGQSTSFLEHLHDPAMFVLPGKTVPRRRSKPLALGGKYKLSVGYCGDRDQYDDYLKALNSGKMPVRASQLRVAESPEFHISPMH